MHGIPLPEIGSIEFNLLSEGIKRERSEKLAFATLLAKLAVATGFARQEQADFLVMEYKEELYQVRYNYNYKRIGDRVREEKARRQLRDMQVLEKVAKLTV